MMMQGSLDEPLHDWSRLSEDALRSWAAQYVGWATNEMSPPEDLAWSLEPTFPLSTFLSMPIEWASYHREEIVENPRYDPSFASADYHTPVVVSIEMGEPIIWDGWHRIACAIHRGDDRILAIAGRETGRGT